MPSLSISSISIPDKTESPSTPFLGNFETFVYCEWFAENYFINLHELGGFRKASGVNRHGSSNMSFLDFDFPSSIGPNLSASKKALFDFLIAISFKNLSFIATIHRAI